MSRKSFRIFQHRNVNNFTVFIPTNNEEIELCGLRSVIYSVTDTGYS